MSDQQICKVCDGGPGNHGVCLCGMHKYEQTYPNAGPNEPDTQDGCDHEGFVGGCRRFGHTPETCPHKPNAADSPDAGKMVERMLYTGRNAAEIQAWAGRGGESGPPADDSGLPLYVIERDDGLKVVIRPGDWVVREDDGQFACEYAGKMVEPETISREEFQAHLQRITEITKDWPEWKRTALGWKVVREPEPTLLEAAEQAGDQWIQTFTGGRVWPMHPDHQENDFNIEDIAHALSMKCRFGGHLKSFYSVAEHCVLGSYLVPQDQALQFLLHDAAEAYLPDYPSPIKPKEFKAAEARLHAAIVRALGLDFDIGDAGDVKRIDVAMLVREALDGFAIGMRRDWKLHPDNGGIPADTTINHWTPAEAESAFLSRFRELKAAVERAKGGG